MVSARQLGVVRARQYAGAALALLALLELLPVPTTADVIFRVPEVLVNLVFLPLLSTNRSLMRLLHKRCLQFQFKYRSQVIYGPCHNH